MCYNLFIGNLVNDMFDDCSGFIDLGKVLEDKYHYSGGDIQSLCQQDFVEIEGNGVDAVCWIKYDNHKYLFKKIDHFEYNVWGELLSSKFAKLLGIPCATYRVASLYGVNGVITESFLQGEDTLVIGSQIFEYYYRHLDNPKSFMNSDDKKKTFRFWNNFEMIHHILSERSDVVTSRKEDIVKFLFDLSTLQMDRHSGNWGLIHRGDKLYTCYLYDNSASFGVGNPYVKKLVDNFQIDYFNSRMFSDKRSCYPAVYKMKPVYFYSSEDIVDKDKMIYSPVSDVFKNFLAHISMDDLDIVDNFFKDFEKINLDDVIHEIEKENGISMKEEVMFYITHIFEENVRCLKEIFLKFKAEVIDYAKRGRS